MLDRLLPRRIDNDYRGRGLALGLALSLRSPGSGRAQG